MTPAKSGPTNVVVVDGSNIATEGRSMPSLAQLNDAVMAFTEEFPDTTVTVVVDATFGHRIDKKELAEFDAAVAHNELVAPPAGAIGRGDAFVLSIANKVGARILSNDSFQEFHGDYPWLFDEGRLIGGKPVPFVGWVFVERLPVKGAVSRKATRSSRGGRDREPRQSRRTASREASLPMPVPTAPPPGAATRRGGRRDEPTTVPADPVAELAAPARPAAPSGGPVNDLLPFLDFVEHHPIGSSVNGVVESYSSHGAYISIGDLRGYVPLRLMGDPPPRSARELMKLGDAVTLVVTSFAPARRSVDLAIPKVAPVGEVVATPSLEEIAEAVEPARTSRRRTAKKAAVAADAASADVVADAPELPAPDAPRPRRSRRAAAAVTEPVAPPATAPAPDAEPAAAAEPAPRPRKASAKKAAATTAPATTAPATKAAVKKAAAKKAPAKKGAAKKAAAKKAAAEAAAAPPAPTNEPPAKKAARKQAPPAPEGATSVDATTAPPAAKAAAKRAPAKRSARKQPAPAAVDREV